MLYPHLPHPTQLTSRAALSQENKIRDILLSRSEHESDPEVQRLHEIVRRSLGDFEVCLKRRGLDNGPMNIDHMAIDTPLRLISWSLPPRLIHLVPDCHASVGNQRPAEDTTDEAELRQLRAQEAAVDADRISTYNYTYNPKTFSTNEIFTPVVTGITPSQLPSLLVTKRHRSAILSISQANKNEPEHCVKCCPLIPVTDQSLSDKTTRKKRRRYPVLDRPPPTFFRPMDEWGGKSGGYAMGWRSNRSANRPKSRQYAHDNMRKGRLGKPN